MRGPGGLCYNRGMGRFLLIGLDGADPALTEQWMAEGRLPHLARLRDDGGAFMPLRSTTPPATFPAWTTCVTGVNPGRHGIFDFTETVPGAHAVRFVNSSYRKAPALWDILSRADKRVGVLGVPATYPPEKVNGFMVAGFDSPVATRIDPSFVYPPMLYPEVKGWRFADFQEDNIGPRWHARALPSLLEGVDKKAAIACKLLRREPWDFFMVVFGESDTVAHHFWMFHDPDSPRYRPGMEFAIRAVYQRLDDAVGRLMDAAGDDITVAVMSDHGFGGAGTGVVHLNNWLAEQGYLRFAPGSGGALKWLALTLVPGHWRGVAFRRLRPLAARVESRARFSGIDWRRTRAWSEELNYFPSIRINLRGRDPQGCVDPLEYDTLVEELCARLEAWPPVARAWPRATLYEGPYVEQAPDIIVELALENGYSYSCLRARGGPSFRRIRPDEAVGGRERGMNGNHRPMGVLFLSERANRTTASLEDIAPTVLATLGVPAPAMDGRSLLGNVAAGADPPDNRADMPPDEARPYTPEEETRLEKRLRALGYYE